MQKGAAVEILLPLLIYWLLVKAIPEFASACIPTVTLLHVLWYFLLQDLTLKCVVTPRMHSDFSIDCFENEMHVVCL